MFAGGESLRNSNMQVACRRYLDDRRENLGILGARVLMLLELHVF
jgi:hypothetical protein